MKMSAKTLLTTLLLSAAFVVPGVAMPSAGTMERHVPHMRGHFPIRFAEPDRQFVATHGQKPIKPGSGHKLVLLDPNYKIVDAPDADPSIYGTRVFGINESGQLSGQYVDSAGAFHAFLATPNGGNFDFTTFTVNGNDTFIGYVNDKGAVDGSYVDNDTGIENSWYRSEKGKITAIQLPDGPNGSFGQWLNNKGTLVGCYIDVNGTYHTYLRPKNGSLTELADADNSGTGDGQGTCGVTINDAGEISGAIMDGNDVSHGFVRSPAGVYTQIDIPGAGTGPFQGTTAVETDEKGWVSGQYIDSNDVFHGFICDSSDCSNTFISVDAPDAGTGSGQGTVAVEHREAGWSVGEYIDSSDVYHGYFRKKNGKITEFDAPGAGDQGTYTVFSSNRDHQIAGTFKDENGIRHGFIRNP